MFGLTFFFRVFLILAMEEDGDWVLVRRATDKDLWNPSSGDGGESSKPLKVTFSGPAEYWTDAIPIGNGRLGAMVWGGVASEILQLNGKVYLFWRFIVENGKKI